MAGDKPVRCVSHAFSSARGSSTDAMSRRFARWEGHELLPLLLLAFADVFEDRIRIMTESGRIFLATFARLGDNGVLPHESTFHHHSVVIP